MSLAATLVLKLQFWFMISLLANHRARLEMQRQQRHTDRHWQTDRKSAITKTKNTFDCAHRQLHCRPSQGPSPPASRPLAKQQSQSLSHAVLETRIMLIQAIQNAIRHHATQHACIALVSPAYVQQPRRDLRPTSHRYRSNTVSSQLTEPPPVRPSRGQ
jgi:hypothetical protein